MATLSITQGWDHQADTFTAPRFDEVLEYLEDWAQVGNGNARYWVQPKRELGYESWDEYVESVRDWARNLGAGFDFVMHGTVGCYQFSIQVSAWDILPEHMASLGPRDQEDLVA